MELARKTITSPGTELSACCQKKVLKQVEKRRSYSNCRQSRNAQNIYTHGKMLGNTLINSKFFLVGKISCFNFYVL